MLFSRLAWGEGEGGYGYFLELHNFTKFKKIINNKNFHNTSTT